MINALSVKVKLASAQSSSKPAWIAIIGLIIVTILGTLVGLGSIVRLVFPATALFIGFYLYVKYPLMYVGFTWWLWFITPLVRRIVDYYNGWANPNPILLAPYLVSAITFLTVLKYLPRSSRLGTTPFVLVMAGIVYGFIIGVIQGSPTTAIRSVLDWLPPVSFAFHLLINWGEYPRYRQNMERVFLWGVLIMGLYGVIQFLVAPVWDTFWLKSVGGDGFGTSFGQAEAFKIRVWSTMASPGPFAGVVGSSLILVFASKNKLRIPAMVVGYLSFILTLVRSSWLGWLLGMIIFFSSLKSQYQIKIIALCLSMLILVVPITMIEPFASVIGSRVESLSNLEEDHSTNARKEIYATNTNAALSTFLGMGIGNRFFINSNGQLQNQALDSGVLDIFFSLGWVGAIPYLSGIGLLLLQTSRFAEVKFDRFMAASRSIAISMIIILLANSAMINAKGMILWGFLGITVAGHQYHQRERIKHDSPKYETKYE